jgi:hypothetical protein
MLEDKSSLEWPICTFRNHGYIELPFNTNSSEVLLGIGRPKYLAMGISKGER